MGTQKRLPTWREMNRDTSPEVEEILFAYWRDTPVWEKWQRMAELNRAARLLALGGLRRRYPHATEAELRRRLADLILGPDLAAAAYGPFPTDATHA